MDGADARGELANALRSLRRDRATAALTQTQVAEALGISNQQVSNWENPKSGQIPSRERLEEYSRLFASHERVLGESGKIRLLEVDELSPEERQTYEQLLERLTTLRGAVHTPPNAGGRTTPTQARGTRFWAFGDHRPIAIIGSELPAEALASIPEADPHHPDHVHALRHADADAVFNLQAHIARLNPESTVRVLLPSQVDPGRDLLGHVVVTGGPSLNSYGDWFVQEAHIEAETLTVAFHEASEPAAWGDRRFRVPRELVPREQLDEIEKDEHGRELAVFRAEFRGTVNVPHFIEESNRVRLGPGPSLYRDLAVIARQPNPVNPETTATLIYGLFGQGTYGASLAFTDPQVREANEAYVEEHFVSASRFWLLVRILCDRRLGLMAPPRLTDAENRLLEWSG
jgi:transcriptional regulator with XRE-family HTH domain